MGTPDNESRPAALRPEPGVAGARPLGVERAATAAGAGARAGVSRACGVPVTEAAGPEAPIRSPENCTDLRRRDDGAAEAAPAPRGAGDRGTRAAALPAASLLALQGGPGTTIVVVPSSPAGELCPEPSLCVRGVSHDPPGPLIRD